MAVTTSSLHMNMQSDVLTVAKALNTSVSPHMPPCKTTGRCNDTQHSDTQDNGTHHITHHKNTLHNDTQYIGISQEDTQHSGVTLQSLQSV